MIIALSMAVLSSAGLVLGQDTNLGGVDFPTSGSPEAQKYFLQGIVGLYSEFFYSNYHDARESFRKAQELEPDFAMAYWGEAMTYFRDRDFSTSRAPIQPVLEAGRAVLIRLAPTPQGRLAKAPTLREKGYLQAIEVFYGDGDEATRELAYAEAMRRLAEEYPGDLEASILYAAALRLTCQGTSQEKEQDLPCYTRASAVAEEVFRANPMHIGAACFLVRTYDDAIYAPLGLRAARVWAQFEPAAHHPSHIFLSMGMWDDVVASNQACVAKYQKNKPHQGHCYMFLEYAYLQLGRYRDARKITTNWARYIIETRKWDLAAIRFDTSHQGLPAAADELFAYGWSWLKIGNQEVAEKALLHLSALRKTSDNNRTAGSWRAWQATGGIEIMEKELRALLLLVQGDGDGSVRLMKEATTLEDSRRFRFGSRPPFIIKPAHELFGEILLELDRPEEARKQFDLALDWAPKRALSLLGLARASAKSGDQLRAQQTYSELRKFWHKADSELPQLEELRKNSVPAQKR